MNAYQIRVSIMDRGEVAERRTYNRVAASQTQALLDVCQVLAEEGLDLRARITSVKPVDIKARMRRAVERLAITFPGIEAYVSGERVV